MADDWIKMRTNLRRHPKVVRMASALKADKLRIVGGLHAAWSVFDEHSEDGVLVGYTPGDLDEEVGWPGFAAAMIAVKWASDDGESLALTEFGTHNGQSAKRRAQDADRKRVVRKTSAPDADKKRTREEKSREEKKKEVTLYVWFAELEGADAIPADDPIFGWADKQGIPHEWIGYAWAAFEDRYAGKDKTYANWRAAFRDHVKRGWLDVWRLDTKSGSYVLTTAGEQWRREVAA